MVGLPPRSGTPADCGRCRSSLFFFNAPGTTEIYTLSLHDALPISRGAGGSAGWEGAEGREARRRRGVASECRRRSLVSPPQPPRRFRAFGCRRLFVAVRGTTRRRISSSESVLPAATSARARLMSSRNSGWVLSANDSRSTLLRGTRAATARLPFVTTTFSFWSSAAYSPRDREARSTLTFFIVGSPVPQSEGRRDWA